MGVLDIQVPNRMLFGLDALNKVGDVARACGERAIIITESEIQENLFVTQLKTILSRAGVNTLIFDELRSNSGNETIQSILTMVKASKPYCVIGMGGMKTLAIARTVAYVAPSRLSLERFLAGEASKDNALPFISIPTTCRDHFMARQEFIMTDGFSQRPVLVRTPVDNTRLVVLDPKISTSLSPKYYSVIIIDVLMAAIEAYTSTQANFYSDILALQAIENIAQAYMELAYNPRDIRPRLKMSEACMLTGLALTSSNLGIGASVSFAVNSRFNIPKAWVATAILPFLLDLHASNQPQRVVNISRALGEDIESFTSEEASMRASRSVRRIIAKLELPSRLRDFNLSLDMLPEIVDIASEMDFSHFVPFSVSHQMIYDLVKQAF